MSIYEAIPLKPHTALCKRSNHKAQQHLAQLAAILEPYSANTSSQTPLKVFADRLPRAVALLRNSELFQRYQVSSVDDGARVTKTATMSCSGCVSLVTAYTGAVGFAVDVLRRSIATAPRPDADDQALAERASALVEELQPTAVNVALHWEELLAQSPC